MTREERPIVFTITERITRRRREAIRMYKVYTIDPRGSDENVDNIYADEIFKVMVDISEVLNNQGYAVLFEAD